MKSGRKSKGCPGVASQGPDQALVIPTDALVLGVDIGAIGALAFQSEDGAWRGYPVLLTRDNGRRKLDVLKNLALLDSVAEQVGGRDRLFVVYERAGKNTRFGIRNSFAGGQNEEFWRVLLTLAGFRFGAVHFKTWQAYCFKGINLPEPKEKAREFVRRNCPDLRWLESFNKAQQSGIVDAMCIALWARAQMGPVTPQEAGAAA